MNCRADLGAAFVACHPTICYRAVADAGVRQRRRASLCSLQILTPQLRRALSCESIILELAHKDFNEIFLIQVENFWRGEQS